MIKNNKTLIVALVIAAAFAAYSLITIAFLKAKLKKFNAQKQKEFVAQVSREKELIRKDLEEKYAADMVSYMAMAKRLELEKNKVRELEAKAAKTPAQKRSK